MTTVREPAAEPALSGTRLVLFGGLAVAVVVGYFALGMPGMDHGGGARTAVAEPAIGVEDFARAMTDPAAFVVNVHVPDEGSIGGTDAAIPYDRIVGDARLPDDMAAPLLLYCKTGRMSAQAVESLRNAGYADVVHLEGGMDAWVAAGRSLE